MNLNGFSGRKAPCFLPRVYRPVNRKKSNLRTSQCGQLRTSQCGQLRTGQCRQLSGHRFVRGHRDIDGYGHAGHGFGYEREQLGMGTDVHCGIDMDRDTGALL